MRVAVLVLLLGMLAFGTALAGPRSEAGTQAVAVPDSFVRGVGLGLFATDPDWDYGPLVAEIRARGATDVLLVVNAYQSTRFASDIALRPGSSPSESNVARTLRQVRQAGMRAALMPVVRLETRTPHEWRGVIAPADGLDAWFAAYRRFVMPLARAAQTEGAVRFVVGSELSSLEMYQERWEDLIAEVRTTFDGALTYSANWDHADEVPFWDSLDEVGLTAYFPLAMGTARDVSSPAQLARAWETPRAQIEALRARVGKPVLVTEVGYVSQPNASARPWDDASGGVVDLRAQQQLYRGFCDAFAETPGVSGFYVWNWFGVGGPRDRGFTPRGKPAATELTRCFSRDWAARKTSGNRS